MKKLLIIILLSLFNFSCTTINGTKVEKIKITDISENLDEYVKFINIFLNDEKIDVITVWNITNYRFIFKNQDYSYNIYISKRFKSYEVYKTAINEKYYYSQEKNDYKTEEELLKSINVTYDYLRKYMDFMIKNNIISLQKNGNDTVFIFEKIIDLKFLLIFFYAEDFSRKGYCYSTNDFFLNCTIDDINKKYEKNKAFLDEFTIFKKTQYKNWYYFEGLYHSVL